MEPQALPPSAKPAPPQGRGRSSFHQAARPQATNQGQEATPGWLLATGLHALGYRDSKTASCLVTAQILKLGPVHERGQGMRAGVSEAADHPPLCPPGTLRDLCSWCPGWGGAGTWDGPKVTSSGPRACADPSSW